MMIMMMMIVIMIIIIPLATLSPLVSDQRTLGRSWVNGPRQQSTKGGKIIYLNFKKLIFCAK